jgi:hypothetical protein
MVVVVNKHVAYHDPPCVDQFWQRCLGRLQEWGAT